VIARSWLTGRARSRHGRRRRGVIPAQLSWRGETETIGWRQTVNGRLWLGADVFRVRGLGASGPAIEAQFARLRALSSRPAPGTGTVVGSASKSDNRTSGRVAPVRPRHDFAELATAPGADLCATMSFITSCPLREMTTRAFWAQCGGVPRVARRECWLKRHGAWRIVRSGGARGCGLCCFQEL